MNIIWKIKPYVVVVVEVVIDAAKLYCSRVGAKFYIVLRFKHSM